MRQAKISDDCFGFGRLIDCVRDDATIAQQFGFARSGGRIAVWTGMQCGLCRFRLRGGKERREILSAHVNQSLPSIPT